MKKAVTPSGFDAGRRASPRADCSLPATISFQGVRLCDAIIKDISTTGMRLFIPNKAWLPHEFDVSTPELSKPMYVRTTWSDGDRVGVEFLFKH